MDKWWKKAVFYEIYMPSFCDGNGDGIGDFAGITSKLDYLSNLGINGIWLTPFYQSPKVDNGYDISDYYSVDPDYGTMADFEQFLSEAHRRNMKVIVDIVLNHTSSEHRWFQESRSSKDHPKRDWYIWKDPVDGKEPNNWESFMGGSAWKFDKTTGQYYYHGFAEEQVDLNWANPEVKQAMFDVMKFWLDKGVDGFRLDVINHLKVKENYPDNPFDQETNKQIHLFDMDQEGILEIIKEVSAFVHAYPDKFLVGEVGSEDLTVLKEYCGTNKLDVVFQFNLGSIPTLDVANIYKQLTDMESEYGDDQIPTLFFGSHDMSRFISRFAIEDYEEEVAKLLATLMLTAKGVPFIYYGDEIGMRDLVIDDISKMKDVQGVIAYQLAITAGKNETEALAEANLNGRDSSRSPMQWASTKHFGFSEVEPWISVPDNDVTVENQLENPESMLSFYRKLIELRKEIRALSVGNYQQLQEENNLLMYERSDEDSTVNVYLNFSHQNRKVSLDDNSNILLSSRRSSILSEQELEILPYEAIIVENRR
ncbi:glycoside hydrolase family 13 protein [Bacillus sp. REN16]|uniref:glycoside hydrolase family 13 protein n=1 Tax=Bacillus sp. REN16 TaxID=2887296 RepID=UPI001E6202EC|nr:alpha-glucosidase [Bacillus sp. REN16]MCC3356833.1 alpha-glucosidase [Bacillus sp. REN16]